MYRRFSLAIALCFAFSTPTVVGDDDMVSRIVKYFPGKWEYKDTNGALLGTAEWKAVAGGKCIAGASQDGATLAFWDAGKKVWVHVWYAANGSHGRLELTKFEGDTYYGEQRVVDGDGSAVVSKVEMKVGGKDQFEATFKAGNEVSVMHWHRIKD